MKRGRGALLLAAAVAVSLSLGACREEEQNRVLLFKKGVYSGAPDTPLSEQARRAQRARMRYQGGITGDERGGTPADVRPPAGAAPSVDELGARARNQGGN